MLRHRPRERLARRRSRCHGLAVAHEREELIVAHQRKDLGLDQRDAFGLHAAQNGRALADDQGLLPEP